MGRLRAKGAWVLGLVLLLLLVLVLATGCQSSPAATSGGDASGSAVKSLPPLPKGAVFQVVRRDGSAKAFTMADIKKFPQRSITVAGKKQEGPGLIEVLVSAGVQDYGGVSLQGSSHNMTLTKAQIDKQTVLDITNRGTIKLASLKIPKASWTKDIRNIVVQ